MARRSLSGAPELDAFDGKGPVRAFDFFHWGEVDEASHRHGGRSPEAHAEAENAAAFLVHYASTLDLDQDALVLKEAIDALRRRLEARRGKQRGVRAHPSHPTRSADG
jgi:hypothetical protein